jgi:mycothiol system anti-sigma-R factor
MSRGCNHAIEYVYHYLDREITWVRRMRIRWHLRKCHACDGAFAFEQRVKAVVRQKGREEPPPELVERLRALIQEEGPGSRS